MVSIAVVCCTVLALLFLFIEVITAMYSICTHTYNRTTNRIVNISFACLCISAVLGVVFAIIELIV